MFFCQKIIHKTDWYFCTNNGMLCSKEFSQ